MEAISSLFEESTLDKGAFFIKKGQYCDQLSFVKQGLIRVYATANGKEITQWISTQGYFITELNSFIFRQRARWNMQALSDCTLYTLKKENYERLKERIPNWPEIEKNFIASCFIILENRVFDFLSLSAEERYDQFFEQHKNLLNQVPLNYIASMLGMSPETLSRIRSKKLS
jgi:CRP-like cAMP-binding protein